MTRWVTSVYLLLALAGTSAAEQSGTVKLHLDTAGKPAAVGTPVSNGIPFPMGAITTVDHVRLETGQGIEVPASFRSLAPWPDGSIKSVLASVVPTPQNDRYPDLVLRYGPTVTHAATGPVRLAQDSQSVTITTDVLKLQLSKSRFTILEQAWTDLNGDGTFDSVEQWLTSPAGLAVLDKKTDRQFVSDLWTAADGYRVTVIESTPQQVTVLLEGRVKGVNGAQTVDGDPTLAQAKVWVTVTAGSTLLHLQTTLVDTKARDTEEFSEYVMHLAGVALELPMALPTATYAAGGDKGAVYQGAVDTQASLLQDATVTWMGREFTYGFGYSGVGSGSKAPGWMDISVAERGATMGIRHFWQNFPQQLTATPETVRLEFLASASRNNAFHTVYPGVGKTYEAFLDLHTGGYTTAVRRRMELALASPLLLADAAWYTSSLAFGKLSPPSPFTAHWESKMANQYNCTVLRQGCDVAGQLFGQRNFGDYIFGIDSPTQPAYGDGHYEDAHGLLLQFIRSLNRGWFDTAVSSARHHYDLDVMHTQNPPRYPGFPPGMIHWHGTSEHEGVNIELGHAVPGGLDEYYLLTGDPRALEVIREQGDWIEHYARSGEGRVAPERSDDGVAGQEYERIGAWTLYTVLKSYEVTGDPKYWEAASLLVKNTIDWWKMPQDHIFFDPDRVLDKSRSPQEQALVYERTDWTKGTGYPLATLLVANCNPSKGVNQYEDLAYQSHVPIAWMSGLLQMALIRYYQDLERRGDSYDGMVMYRDRMTPVHIDAATMREMLIQILNKVVEYNYLGAPKYPSKYPFLKTLGMNEFIYTVCERIDYSHLNNVGLQGGQYLLDTMLFISSFTPQEVGPLWQAQWPQMQAKWQDIAQILYNGLVVRWQGADNSANGMANLLDLPYAVARMEELGLLTNLPPPSSGGGGGPPPLSSTPDYIVTVNGGPLVTSRVIDLSITAPAAAVETNVSMTGYSQGTWQPTGDVRLTLPAGSGAKTIFVQFRDQQRVILASLTQSVVLIEPNFTGDVDLMLNDPTDTFIFSNQADGRFGAQRVLKAGRYDTGYDYVGLLAFELPTAPPGVALTVQGAQLSVYVTDNSRNGSQTITPYEITSEWSEDTATWNSRPTLAASGVGSGVTFGGRSEINQWEAFTLQPSSIQRSLQTPTPMFGVALMGQGSPGLTSVDLVSSEAVFPSEDRRPRLTLRLHISSGATTPAPQISGVRVESISSAAGTVTWTTDKPTTGLVEYGPTASYGGGTVVDSVRGTTHRVQLTNLASNTLYHVGVSATDDLGMIGRASDFTFTTSAGAQRGDINKDGQLTRDDLLALIAQLLGRSPVTPDVSDANADGKVTLADAWALARRLSQPSSTPPTLTITRPTASAVIIGTSVDVTYQIGGDFTAAGVTHVHVKLDANAVIEETSLDGRSTLQSIPAGNHTMTISLAKANHSIVGAPVAVNFTTQVSQPSTGDWVQIWNDEFDGAAGSLPDPGHWVIETGNHGFGGAELQAYTNRPSNVHLDGQGNLIITARRENYNNRPYTSGRIHTRGIATFDYGAFEARIKDPKGSGFGPTFWLAAHAQGYAETWPAIGEVDMMEIYGVNTNRNPMTVVGPQVGNRNNAIYLHSDYTYEQGGDATNWHVYRMEKDPNVMRFYVDGKMVFEAAPKQMNDRGAEWIYEKGYRYYIIFCLAIGGNRPYGQPDGSTPFPSDMVVDYVRAYQRK